MGFVKSFAKNDNINPKQDRKKDDCRGNRNLAGRFAVRRGMVLLVAAIMLFAVLAGCSGRNRADSVSGNAGLQSGAGSEDAVPGNGTVGASGDGSGNTSAGSTDASGRSETGAGGDGTVAGTDASSEFPLTVTDANGDVMTLENPPKRIISLTLGSDEILLSLVDKSRIVSLTRYADDEGISVRTTMDQIENIIALEPDLVITDTWADINYIKQLRDSGITVYAFRTPNNIDEQRAVVAELAHVVGADGKGQELVNWMDEKLKAVEERLSVLKPEQKLTVMDYGELGSSGKGTNFDDIVTRAGLINVVSRAGIEGWPVISKEKIIEFNPDIIILPSWYYDAGNTFESMRDSLVNDPSLQTVSAIKNNRIISVPRWRTWQKRPILNCSNKKMAVEKL